MSRVSQAELRQQVKDKFLSDTKARFENLINKYFLTQGIFLLAADLYDSAPEVTMPIQPIIARAIQTRRLVDDGANLTDKRKIEILGAIYDLEKMVSEVKEDHPLNDFYEELTMKRIWFGVLLIIVLISSIVGYFWTPAWGIAAISFSLLISVQLKISALKKTIKNEAIQVISII